MIAFFSIVKNTYLSSVRSFVFQILLVILITCTIVLPQILTGDGTPASNIRVTIDYTIWVVSFILTASSLWLSCNVMNYDLDYYQMHMISSKPIRRSTVWLGKFTGLLLIHSALLLISFVVFYFVLYSDINSSSYSKESKNDIKEKILIAREEIYPNFSQIDLTFKKKWKDKKNELEKNDQILSKEELYKLKRSTFYQTLTQEGQIEPDKRKVYTFQNLKGVNSKNITLKFKFYVGDINMVERQKKPTALGYWELKNPKTNKFDLIDKSQINYISNIFYELNLPSGYVDSNGNIELKFSNESTTSMFFQLNESPLLLVKKASFLNNYFRSFIVIILCLIFVLSLGCSFGSIFSFPIAVFAVISYLLVGSISNFILSAENPNQPFSSSNNFGISLSNSMLHIVIPLQKFQSSESLSSGRLITNNQIWKIIFDFILLREFPLIFICIYIYSKRELGLIIKKT